MNRRSFLATSAAVILTPGLLMPVRKLWTPADLSEATLEQIILDIAKMTDSRGLRLAIEPRWVKVLRPGIEKAFADYVAL